MKENNPIHKLYLQFYRDMAGYVSSVYITKKENGKYYNGKINWKEMKIGEVRAEPAFSIHEENIKLFVDNLLDELKREGLLKNKPNEDQYKAINDHLSDMRKLVFKDFPKD